MTIEVFLNRIGFPKIGSLSDKDDLPGIGEKITLNENNSEGEKYEVTEVKKDNDNTIHIYVNSLK